MGAIEERRWDDGTVTFRARVRLHGYPPESATFKRKTDARRWVQDIESAMREGRYFKTAEARKKTLSDLITRYLDTVVERKPKSKSVKERHLNWWRERLGAYVVADITTAMIGDCTNELLKQQTFYKRKHSEATINRYLASLSHLFSVATREWEVTHKNPVSSIPKGKETLRIRYLSEDERARLLQACKESRAKYLYPAVVLSLCTGARQSEILSMRWSQIDWKHELIRLEDPETFKPKHKGDQPKTLPLKGMALELLKERRDRKVVPIDKHSFVFPSLNGQKPVYLRSAWEAALKRARIKNFRWHDLRHSCASYLAMDGANMKDIAELLGHKVLATTMRYAHLSQERKGELAERLSQKLFSSA